MPVMIPLVIGMIIGPYTKWGKDDISRILNRIKVLVLFLFLASLILWYIHHKDPVISIIFLVLGSWIIISSIFEIIQPLFSKKKLFDFPKKILGQVIAHIGVGLLIIGATGSSILKQEKIQFQKVGETITIKKYKVNFQGVKKIEGPNYLSYMGFFEISSNKKIIKTLKPEKRFYNYGKQVTTEADIHSTLLGDLYIVIGDMHIDNNQWTTRIWFNPFTLWIWIGVFFLVSGGLISFFNILNRKK
jgi:cytochrome c-type biogenesis protein CcmF